VLFHAGSPHTGELLEPLLRLARQHGVRLLGYARPSYGGSTPQPGRTVASAAADVAELAAALDLRRFAVLGYSGGGPHALACAARLPDRVAAVACLAGVAPYRDEPDWYAGMRAPGGLQAAARGRVARAEYARTDEFDPEIFVAADWAALNGDWAAVGADATLAGQAGPDGLIDDDVALATAWGFELAEVTAPVLLVQGSLDRVIPAAHADALLHGLPRAELWLRPRDGHVAVLGAVPVALDWLLNYGTW
jgi:pimeloyl-ACP methyl ester carboxylesterase